MPLRIAGKLASGTYLERLKQSPNFQNGAFQNLVETPMLANDASYWKILRDFFRKNELKSPPVPVPSIKTDLQGTLPEPCAIWFGHSSYFLKIEEKNILVDPVFSGSASPLSWMIKSFEGSDIYTVADMPAVDYLVLTHDHYDHLDYKTIVQLKDKVKQVICSLGVAAHLLHWGYSMKAITELDWWQTAHLDDGWKLTAAPARHFSGRGLRRGQSLWSSFALQTSKQRVYIGGDSGYGDHFKKIGKEYGPFDIAFLECGQYDKMWPYIHMMPEETVQAAMDLHANIMVPVHWGKFALSRHAWNEPIIRASAKAKEAGVNLRMPKIGEVLQFNGPFVQDEWWRL
jgi:L-ascorbate metabolism protein UlaG (beta-lactamase superfamily)